MSEQYPEIGMPEQQPPYYGNTAQDAYQNNQDNLTKWRLDIERDLEIIDHSLKDETPGMVFNKKKNEWEEAWVRAPENERTFNDYGVRQIMKKISIYLRKVFTLSFYDNDRLKEIDKRLSIIGEDLTDEIFNNAYAFGADTPQKISQLKGIVLKIHQIIEANYRRAMLGREAKQLAPIWNINENVSQNNNGNGGGFSPISKFNLLNPSSWKGKY